jgi:hypothetical protein
VDRKDQKAFGPDIPDGVHQLLLAGFCNSDSGSSTGDFIRQASELMS